MLGWTRIPSASDERTLGGGLQDAMNRVWDQPVAFGSGEQPGVVRQLSQELAGVRSADQAVEAPYERWHAARDCLARRFFLASGRVGRVLRQVHR